MSLHPYIVLLAVIAGVLLTRPAAASSEAEGGETVYAMRCASCHEQAAARTPSRAQLAVLSPAAIYNALTKGPMVPMSIGLTENQKHAVAAYLAQSPTSASVSNGLGPKCAINPTIRPSGSDWTSVGFNNASHRYQPHPGLSTEDVPRLKVKWSFAMAGGSMPTVIGDWLFITNRSGEYYALDPATGCVRWVIEGVGSRTTPMIVASKISPSGWATFIGERSRVLRAIDAETGKDIWISKPLHDHPAAIITGSPMVAGDKIIVPISSAEEGLAMDPAYSCCSFQGSVVALAVSDGKVLWDAPMITKPVGPTRKNKAGVMMRGPAGAAIWSAPTFDEKRNLVYVATGDSYTDLDADNAEAIVAIDASSGKIRWSHQVTENDNWIVGCTNIEKPTNCPQPAGGDYDFGASPILLEAEGRELVVSGQKSGLVYGMDPDTGRLRWTARVGAGSSLGGIEWGMATDGTRLYVANADTWNLIDEAMRPLGKAVLAAVPAKGRPGLTALDPESGRVLWETPAPTAPCRYSGDVKRQRTEGICIRAQSQAPSVMPGVVFSGTMDGWFRAYDAATGRVLWSDSTTSRTYETVNGVHDQPGGSLDGMGPAIAGGRVFVMSGYVGAASIGGNPVNVLLAYTVDGK